MRWIKAYKGPFKKEEALGLAKELKETTRPDLHNIYNANIRRRKKTSHCVCTAVCGAGLGHNLKYDVWIKTDERTLIEILTPTK